MLSQRLGAAPTTLPRRLLARSLTSAHCVVCRTIDGFRTLVQKEFVAFGHMCRKRLGTVTYTDQRSPCLLQFFECVHHICLQRPTEFEFNDSFLRTLAALTDCELFGDFFADSEKERSEQRYGQDAPSMWGHLCAVENRNRYSTVGYTPTCDDSGPSLLPVRCSLKYLHLWNELYCKYDEVEYSADEIVAGFAVGKVENQALRCAMPCCTAIKLVVVPLPFVGIRTTQSILICLKQLNCRWWAVVGAHGGVTA